MAKCSYRVNNLYFLRSGTTYIINMMHMHAGDEHIHTYTYVASYCRVAAYHCSITVCGAFVYTYSYVANYEICITKPCIRNN